MILTDEEAGLSGKVYNLVKDLEGLVKTQCHSDGIHDSNRFSLHFSKDVGPVLLDLDRYHDKEYMESWREECRRRAASYEMYWFRLCKNGLEIRMWADSSKASYTLPDKIKNYFSQKLPGAKLSQPDINVFRWAYDSPEEFEKILNQKTLLKP